MRTYINAGLLEYLSSRYHSEHLPRMAVIPFSVPETFAPGGEESRHFGRELAGLFQRELLRTGELAIVELFNRESWPGKRAEFNSGNYGAIRFARDAGYDLILVGYMDEITNASDLTVYTRLIDTENSATLWFAKTVSFNNDRKRRRILADIPFSTYEDRPDLFAFPERAERLAECTTKHILEDDPLSPSPDYEVEAEEGTERALRGSRRPGVFRPR